MTDSPFLYRLDGIRRLLGPEFTLAIDRLEIAAGETLCIVGPTGAGKTTLLRLLTGLESPDQGEVQFAQSRWGRQVPAADVLRSIVLVPQRPIMLARSVRANVEYGLRLRNVASSERSRQMLKRLGLERLSGQSARTLSGGQIQLVALARALVLEPKVLLLDEPTANLDPAYVRLIEDVLREFRSEHQTTFVWATHNLGQVQRVADRACLLLDGRIVETAPVEPFFKNPRDPRTRAFVEGTMVY